MTQEMLIFKRFKIWQRNMGGPSAGHDTNYILVEIPNTWNGFIHQRLNNINKDILKGDRWKLTEFISAHKETLQYDYSKLTATQKNSYAVKLIKMCAEKQCVVHDIRKMW
ncbi:uncharacterized protein EDB91DRAFT_1085833 [Suillus paluster]|uniref:uncharacterized protein n=1 Tax=Suillus paluster TaxID=48578 RepID=UPI001B85E0C9|nr:uncharacterized protein EDB91DRAFT_1085833 [Suillus paluster]KAG1729222.1 hypothetical protein EDB91DRAFT_1085833 [Suillus paluster]